MSGTMQEVRNREYKYLVGRLYSLGLRLDRDLFVATLNVLTNIEHLGFTKDSAIKMEAKQTGVKQVEIKRVLDEMNYLTPRQVLMKYGGKTGQRTKDLKRKLELEKQKEEK